MLDEPSHSAALSGHAPVDGNPCAGHLQRRTHILELRVDVGA